MDALTKKEVAELLKAIKILREGEVLLGIDIDKKLIEGLLVKLSKAVDKATVKKIDKEIRNLVKEAQKFNENGEEEYSEEDFDRMFGPNYPYSDTLRLLNNAIEKGQYVSIEYYSASQGKFTKRKVKPKSIERRNGVPYLNAYCYLRKADRVFKLGRIKSIKIVK